MPEFNIEGIDEERMTAVRAEIDRRVTEAIKTNTATVTRTLTEQLDADKQKAIQDAVAGALSTANVSQEEQAQALMAQVEAARLQTERMQRQFKVERTLLEAGFNTQTVTELSSLFEATPLEALDDQLGKFISVRNESVETALQAQREELALSNTPPPNGSNGTRPQSETEVYSSALNQGVDPHTASAMMIQSILNQSQEEGNM